jgi:hypothetical protein
MVTSTAWRAMEANTAVDNFDAVIASHGNGLLAEV